MGKYKDGHILFAYNSIFILTIICVKNINEDLESICLRVNGLLTLNKSVNKMRKTVKIHYNQFVTFDVDKFLSYKLHKAYNVVMEHKKYLRDGRSPVPKNSVTSKVMSANKAKNTKPELILRKALWQ